MSNEYYTPPSDIIAGVRARSEKINDIIQSVDVGFDNLPPDLVNIIASLVTGSGVKITVNDLAVGVLDDKLLVDDVITKTVNNPGDVETLTLTVPDDAVSYAKVQNIVSDDVLLGNVSGADKVISELTPTQVRTLINVESGADVTDATNVAAAGAVMDTGNEAVAGIKTFSSSPIVPTPTTDMQVSTKKYIDDIADGFIISLGTKVSLTGNETIAGVKTFSSRPIVPTPLTNYQVSTKAYVDSVIPSGTSMVFYQAAAPTGWTKKSDWAANASLVVGNSFGTGGSDSPTYWAASPGIGDHATHTHTGPSHNHSLGDHNHLWYDFTGSTTDAKSYNNSGSQVSIVGANASGQGIRTSTLVSTEKISADFYTSNFSGNTGLDGTGNTGSGGPTTHSVTPDVYTPKYQILIVATKN